MISSHALQDLADRLNRKSAIYFRRIKNPKLPEFLHHSMRHFFVSNAIEAGIDFKVIANWVGHKDGGVLVAKTYGHLRDTHSFEMGKRMDFDSDSTLDIGAKE